nr:hypothetical protein [uncultured Sphingobacterium sp.]
MKPLENLTNTERARMLHQLFPHEIPALIEFTEGVCLAIIQEEKRHRANWDNGLFTFDYWLSLLVQVGQNIGVYGKAMGKRSALFAEHLFSGHLAMVMAHAMYLYTTTRQHPNRKFTLAIDLLFHP